MTFSSQRERELVEAVRELIRASWGTSAHLRAEFRVSLAVHAYDHGFLNLVSDDPGIEETDIVMGR